MSWWRQQLGACFDSVATQLPQLQSSLSQLGHSMGEWVGSMSAGLGSSPGAAEVGKEYQLGARRFRVARQLGEGGYSFVYLVREVQADGGLVSSHEPARHFALKRVLCGSDDQLAEARREVGVMRRLRHPCLLPLLEAAVQAQHTPDGGSRTVVLMLFPVYDQGNLHDFLQQQRSAWRTAPTDAASHPHAGGGAAHPVPLTRAALRAQHLAEALQIFLQVCAALHSMHSMDPPLAHRDLKPHNVLLRARRPRADARPAAGYDATGRVHAGAGAAAEQVDGSLAGERYDPTPPVVAGVAQQDGDAQQWAAGDWDAGSGLKGAAAAAGSVSPAAVVAVQEERGQQSPQPATAAPPADWWERRLAVWRQRHEAVLMDFGSTRTARVQVGSRAQAMAVQEDAERQCTAPYRAPELWDVPSSCTIDERVDVWSLGCLLYFLVCGESPFERAVGEMGGSLMLAIVNGRFSWPDDPSCSCPAAVRELTGACLASVPAQRPSVAEVAARADAILASLPLPS